MVNPVPILQTIATDTWIKATWEEFLTFADDPTLVGGRFYYEQGEMRIEMAALGTAHSRDNSIVSTAIVLFAALKNIRIIEFTNCSFKKTGIRECQPDIAFYIGSSFQFPPRSNSPVDLNQFAPPTLVIEIGASSLSDDLERKRILYQNLGVQEYWVVDVNALQIIAFTITQGKSYQIQQSHVLPGLAISVVETALMRSQTEDDGAITRWLLSSFSQS
ncbi:MAG: Uma2 family endonuclease [Tolypothrix sp. T3-bin4]|nr:Uma2 family endonuclease [Tolypothrix sp. T3-bin4]